jgi:hypothetical protein
MDHEKRLDEQLAGIEPSRRTFIKRVAIGAAFATPVISSFSMSGLSVNAAAALAPHNSGVIPNSIDN